MNGLIPPAEQPENLPAEQAQPLPGDQSSGDETPSQELLPSQENQPAQAEPPAPEGQTTLVEDLSQRTRSPAPDRSFPLAEDERQAKSANLLASLAGASAASLDRLAEIGDKLDRLQQAVDSTGKNLAFIPPQVRGLSGKVEQLATTISESRYQALLLRLLGFYDLLCGMQRAAQQKEIDDNPAQGNAGKEPNNLEVLHTQLYQLLQANGLSEVPTSGGFDPRLHFTAGRLMVTDPAMDGQIVEVIRPGFQTETSVLRFAEVRVGYYPYAVEEE